MLLNLVTSCCGQDVALVSLEVRKIIIPSQSFDLSKSCRHFSRFTHKCNHRPHQSMNKSRLICRPYSFWEKRTTCTCIVDFMLWLYDYQVLNVSVLYMIYLMSSNVLCCSSEFIPICLKNLHKNHMVIFKMGYGHCKSHEWLCSESKWLQLPNVAQLFYEKEVSMKLDVTWQTVLWS